MKSIGGMRALRSLVILAVGMGGAACGDGDNPQPVPDAGLDATMDGSLQPGDNTGTERDAAALDGAAADPADDAAAIDVADAGGPMAVEIEFEARVGDEAFDCTRTYQVGTGPSTVLPLDFRLYVHDVALLTTDGAVPVALQQDGAFQHEGVALLDFEDDRGTCSNGTSQVHTTIVGEVPRGSYTGLTFKIGVPEAQNHVNQAEAPSPLNIEGMFWSWTTGYKFLRIDVQAMADAEPDAGAAGGDSGIGHAGGAPGFNVHLGSTMCSGNPSAAEPVTCQRQNRPELRAASFDAKRHKIVVDLAELVSGSDVSKNMGAQPGCMSGATDPECPAIFEQLGLDLSTGASNANPPFLRVVEK